MHITFGAREPQLLQGDRLSNLTFLSFQRLFYSERRRERQLGRGRGRERDGIPSRLRTVSVEPNVGLDLMNCEIMT